MINVTLMICAKMFSQMLLYIFLAWILQWICTDMAEVVRQHCKKVFKF